MSFRPSTDVINTVFEEQSAIKSPEFLCLQTDPVVETFVCVRTGQRLLFEPLFCEDTTEVPLIVDEVTQLPLECHQSFLFDFDRFSGVLDDMGLLAQVSPVHISVLYFQKGPLSVDKLRSEMKTLVRRIDGSSIADENEGDVVHFLRKILSRFLTGVVWEKSRSEIVPVDSLGIWCDFFESGANYEDFVDYFLYNSSTVVIR